MSRQYSYTRFQNKVPAAFERMKCRPFDLEIPVEVGYEKAQKKALVIIGKITTQDLVAGRLLGGEGDPLRIMDNLLTEASRWAGKLGDAPKYRYAFLNFNFFKNYGLSSEAYASSLKDNVKRVRSYVKKMKPDLIIVFGDEAMATILRKERNVQWRRGTVFDYPYRKKVKIVHTIEWDAMIAGPKDSGRQQIDKANLLGFAYRCVASGLLGKHPLDLSSIKPKAIVVKDLAAYKKLRRKLDKAQKKATPIAVDTETGGLQVIKNRIATIQFATSAKKSYIVILDHQDTPFSVKDLTYIKKDLQQFFGQKMPMYQGKKTAHLVIHGGKFDMRILRSCLKIPFIYWPFWDTLAGEFCLDENLVGLQAVRTNPWNLAHTFARYGNDFYYRSEFSKSERHLLADNPITKKELEYCSMDVQSIWGIHKMQQATASIMEFEGKSYLEPYRRLVLVQMSNNIHQMSSMVLRGNDIDKPYLIYIASKTGPINKLMDAELKKLYALPSVIKANEKLAGKAGVPKTGLFGKAKTPWVFSLNNEAHKQFLYIKQLGLEPLSTNEESGNSSLDKWFQKAHSEVPEVQILSRRNKLAILRNTFAKGILNRASSDPDIRIDGRLRPDYDFSVAVTGRSNSSGPSLQQIPEHSAEAKIIKRMFIAPEGKIHIKMDYSSHEVRGWGYVAKDNQVAQSFQNILNVITKFRLRSKKREPTQEDRDRLKAEGDIHRINYSMFTGVPVLEVTDTQRQGAKQIVFGSIYGMSAKSLAEGLGITEEEAEDLIEKFFGKAKKAKKWLDDIAIQAQTHHYAHSPLGRRRNLYAMLSGDRRIISGCNRRAQNSPIQGMSSDFGFNAARLMEMCIYETFVKLGRPTEDLMMLSSGVMQMVHDSIKLEMEYKDFFIILWITEYCAVYGLRKLVEETFDFQLNVDFAIEVEVGSTGDTFKKWDWTSTGLKKIIENAIVTQKDVLGHDVNVKKVMKLIYKEGEKHKPYLMKKYPLPIAPL